MEDKIKNIVLGYERYHQSINAPIAKIKKILEEAYLAGRYDYREPKEINGFEKWFNKYENS